MSFGFSLAFLGSISSATITVFTLFKANRSLVRWSFGLGMLVLALEGFWSSMAAESVLPGQVVSWETWAFTCMALLPAIWLFFSLSYGRGNHTEFLQRWRLFLLLSLFVPLTCCLAFRQQLVSAVAEPGGRWMLRVGFAGFVLNILLVITWILVLMNLEATFRASVGTMRWRVKFIVLGLSVLFAVRIYTGTELLLFKSISLAQNDFNSAALLVACLLMFRSLLRVGHFEIGVYPSQSL